MKFHISADVFEENSFQQLQYLARSMEFLFLSLLKPQKNNNIERNLINVCVDE